MTPAEVKRIVCSVVDHAWPWQANKSTNSKRSKWCTPADQSLANLGWVIFDHFDCGGTSWNSIRLDPIYAYDWPIETRDGMPVWAWDRVMQRYFYFDSILHAKAVLEDCMKGPCVAPHPIHLDEPPPADWTPEGRRVLK